jgi:cyclopropane fatty-acyl-phospholipid synthase-like methyltransferase
VTQPLWRRAAKQTKLLLYRCATPIDRVLQRNTSTILPPAHLRLYYYGTLQPARFARSCETAALELTSRGLKPEHRVLDIGSGLGNLAWVSRPVYRVAITASKSIRRRLDGARPRLRIDIHASSSITPTW